MKMSLKKVATEQAPAAIGPYSQGIVTGNLVFVSGQLPIDPKTGAFAEGDIKVLTTQSMKNISAILEQAGSSVDKIVKTTTFVADLADFAAVNEAYAAFFPGIAPARSCVQVAAIPKGARVEIEAIAEL